MLQRESQDTFYSTNSFENRAIYKIMLKNSVETERPQLTIWRMRIACWTNKATDALSEHVILIAFPLQNGYTNAPQVYVTCIPYFSFFLFISVSRFGRT